jgi:hypothetical protein
MAGNVREWCWNKSEGDKHFNLGGAWDDPAYLFAGRDTARRGGRTYGETDEFGYYAVRNKVHMHDMHATVLHLLGLDHERLTVSGMSGSITITVGPGP